MGGHSDSEYLQPAADPAEARASVKAPVLYRAVVTLDLTGFDRLLLRKQRLCGGNRQTAPSWATSTPNTCTLQGAVRLGISPPKLM